MQGTFKYNVDKRLAFNLGVEQASGKFCHKQHVTEYKNGIYDKNIHQII
jgi:hypothetical protein